MDSMCNLSCDGAMRGWQFVLKIWQKEKLDQRVHEIVRIKVNRCKQINTKGG